MSALSRIGAALTRQGADNVGRVALITLQMVAILAGQCVVIVGMLVIAGATQ